MISAQVSWDKIRFVSRDDLEFEADVDTLDNATFYDAAARRLNDPELADMLIAMETPKKFRAYDFMLLYRGQVVGLCVKRDPIRWQEPPNNELTPKEKNEFNEIKQAFATKKMIFDLDGDLRRLDKLRLCVKAYKEIEEFDSDPNVPLSVMPAAIFGFPLDDIRQDFAAVVGHAMPDSFVGRDALDDSVPGGLLIFSTVARLMDDEDSGNTAT